MSIIIGLDHNTPLGPLQDWLGFNNIQHQSRSFWHVKQQIFCLPADIKHSIVAWGHEIFWQFVQQTSYLDDLQRFCSEGNQLWLFGDDITLRVWRHHDAIKTLARKISGPGGLVFFLDGQHQDKSFFSDLGSIKMRVLPYNNFVKDQFRLQTPSLEKINATYDFLLTMIRKPEKPHREFLWQQLQQRPNLRDRGFVTYKDHDSVTSDNWAGNPGPHGQPLFHASMDLYLDCWIEVVAETCVRDLYFFTEKTRKPIVTKTPFLIASTPGYLSYVRNLGFRTFHSLIDESYDQEVHLESRIKKLVDVLEHVVENGAEEFYQASHDILSHNFSRLCEIIGGWEYTFDLVMWKSLENFDPKLYNESKHLLGIK